MIVSNHCGISTCDYESWDIGVPLESSFLTLPLTSLLYLLYIYSVLVVEVEVLPLDAVLLLLPVLPVALPLLLRLSRLRLFQLLSRQAVVA